MARNERQRVHPKSMTKSEQRRASLFTLVTAAIIGTGVFYGLHAYDNGTTVEDTSSRTAISHPIANESIDTFNYRFTLLNEQTSRLPSVNRLPTKVLVAAPSLPQAIETLANKYSLTVDAEEGNTVTFITKDGFQLTERIDQIRRH